VRYRGRMLLPSLLLGCSPTPPADSAPDDSSPPTDATFTLSSANLADGEPFPDEHTCAGADRQPELHWDGVPDGTASFALTLEDRTIDYVHWVVFDLPAATTALAGGASDDEALPDGTLEARAYGTQYRGPCPRGDEHTYVFTLRALDVATVEFTAANPIDGADLAAAFDAATLGSATLSGTSDASP
jgi:Raf kinase inhibitor-like YbhB/YbcL family protein